MAGFRDILSRIQKAKGSLSDNILDMLANEGRRIVEEANRSAEAQNRTGNMADAYGYAVYLNGKEMRRGYANATPTSSGPHKGWPKYGIPADTGRGYLDSFFETYIPPAKGYHLVTVNAAYYSRILEEGAQARPRRQVATKYRIISQMTDEMDRLAAKYRGELTTINI